MSTNVDYYVADFDADGKRVGSIICDYKPGTDKAQAVLEKGKTLFANAAVVEIISAADFDAYLSGMVRGSDGKPVAYVAPEPTEAEKKEAQRAALTAEYNAEVASLKESLTTAALNGDTDTEAEIKAEYTELTESYKEELEALK